MTLMLLVLAFGADPNAEIMAKIRAADAAARRPAEIIHNPIVAGPDANTLPLTPKPKDMPPAGLTPPAPDYEWGQTSVGPGWVHKSIVGTQPAVLSRPEVRAPAPFRERGADVRLGLPAGATLTTQPGAVVDRSHACPSCGNNNYADLGWKRVIGWNPDGSHSHRCGNCGTVFSH